MNGIYCYTDNQTNEIVYIGKDSHIDIHRRHKDHTGKWAYNVQHINKVIQNNPNRYTYNVMLEGELSDKLLNAFEMAFIKKHDPLFNFTDGGEGVSGFKHNPKSREKMSKSHIGQVAWNKGKKIPELSGENHPMYGKHHKKSTKDIISKKNRNKFAAIHKNGFDKKLQKQVYTIYMNQKIIKRSFHPIKLMEWFKSNYPNKLLIIGGILND
jgi:group I intron endonuclease